MTLSRNSLAKAYDEIPFPKKSIEESSSRFNEYVCSYCKHKTKTRDDAFGITPLFHDCEVCGELADSMLYFDNISAEGHTQVWYRPSLEECQEMNKNRDPKLKYVLEGGLLNKKI